MTQLEALREACAVLKALINKGIIVVRSEKMVRHDDGTRCSWIEHGSRKAMDTTNDVADRLRAIDQFSNPLKYDKATRSIKDRRISKRDRRRDQFKPEVPKDVKYRLECLRNGYMDMVVSQAKWAADLIEELSAENDELKKTRGRDAMAVQLTEGINKNLSAENESLKAEVTELHRRIDQMCKDFVS